MVLVGSLGNRTVSVSDSEDDGDYQQRQMERLEQHNYHRFHGGGDGAAVYTPAPPPKHRSPLRNSYKTVRDRIIYKNPVDRMVEYERGVEAKKARQRSEHAQRLADYAAAMRIHNEGQQASSRLRRHMKHIEEEAILDDLRASLGVVLPSGRPSTVHNSPGLLAIAPLSIRLSESRPHTGYSLPSITERTQDYSPRPHTLSLTVQQRLLTPKGSPRGVGAGGVGRVGYAPYIEESGSQQHGGRGQQLTSEFEDFDLYHAEAANRRVSIEGERRANGPVHHSTRSFRELLPSDFQPATPPLHEALSNEQVDWEPEGTVSPNGRDTPVGQGGSSASLRGEGSRHSDRPATKGKPVQHQSPLPPHPITKLESPRASKKAAPPPIPPPISPRDLPLPRYALCTPDRTGVYGGEDTYVGNSRISNPQLRREHEEAVRVRLEHLLQQSEQRKRERAQQEADVQLRIEDAKWRRKNPLRAAALDRLLSNSHPRHTGE